MLGERPTSGINERVLISVKQTQTFSLSLHYYVNENEILKFKSDNKNVDFPTQFCWKIMNFKKFILKIVRVTI